MKNNLSQTFRFKSALLFLFITSITFKTYSQITYEPGYLIDNEGKRKECFIKDLGWYSNPTQFMYVFSIEDDPKTADIKEIKEFGFDTGTKYVRYKVSIDKTSDVLNNEDFNRLPNYEMELVFLKTIIDSKASLYQYRQRTFNKYFYSTKKDTAIQLFYKEYMKTPQKVGTNNAYKQELWNNLKSDKITQSKIENLTYNEKSLVKLFNLYNSEYETAEKKIRKSKKTDDFNLSLKAGLGLSSLDFTGHPDDFKLQNDLIYRFGLELEFIFPFYKNKLSFVADPSFHSYKIRDKVGASLNFNSIEIPVGVRHYFFLNNSKLFINAFLIKEIDFNSEMELGLNLVGRKFKPLQIESALYTALGGGIKLKNNLSFELRYYVPRDILNGYPSYVADYQNISLTVGYTMF